MEQNHFMQNIEETYHSLTKVEKKVADYVLQNPRQVLFMSITDLADACQVGETSVYRFCRTMNLQGYQEFKMQLSLGMSEQDEEWAPREDNQSLEKTLKESAERLLQKHTEALEETLNNLQRFNFNKEIELSAEDIRLAARALGKITGRIEVEDILNKIFGSFCIGK